MNDRAIELYKQAIEFAYTSIGKDHADTSYFQGTVAGKFAELIVEECCNRLSEETIRHDGYGYNQHELYNRLRKHFGVEE